MVVVGDLVALLDELAPPALAEPWDNGGLLVGDPLSEAAWVAVALDPDDALAGSGDALAGLGAALPGGPGLLVVHHPLPFHPLSRLVETDPAAALIARLVRRGVALAATHTAYDSGPGGLSHALAVALGLELEGLSALAPASGPGSGYLKLVVFVPEDSADSGGHAAAVRAALGRTGAGHIGNYSDCAFTATGHGYYRPGPGADPYQGTVGHIEEAAEQRIETILPAYTLDRVVRAMVAAHPYEEVAYDVYRLEGHPPVTRPELLTGIGRVGRLPAPVSLGAFRAEVERRLGLPPGAARLVTAGRPPGPPPADRPVQRVAVCPGSGGDYVSAAAGAGADVYVTGDVGHHDAVEATRRGLVVIDAGHAGTERLFVPHLAERLRNALAAQGIRLPVSEVPPLEMGDMV